MSWYNLEDTRGDDPANWDCCDEHERVFAKGDSCPDCDHERQEIEDYERRVDAEIGAHERQLASEEQEREERYADCYSY